MTFSELADRIAQNTRANPSDYAKVLGEPLAEPVYWTGRQWAVTAYGVECRDGKYVIDAKRLWDDEDKYGWILHMAEKEWVDIEDFIAAIVLARVKFKERFPRQ